MTTTTTTTTPRTTAPTTGHEADRAASVAEASALKKVYLALECTLLYVFFPVWIDIREHRGFLIPFLVVVAVVCFLYLLLDKSFDRKRLWNFPSFKKHAPRIMLTWAIGVAVMAGFVLIARPFLSERAQENVHLFGMLDARPVLWGMIMVLYPLFSVYPQEIVLRTFFFQRYKPLLTRPWVMILANGLVFAWVHVIFQNWVAVVLCVPAGILFAYTYWSSRSTITSGFEHALFGNAMWTVGLGYFFYAGAVQ